jgi:hypothetical protein
MAGEIQTQWELSMEKTIIACAAALLLSAGAAVAQSSSDQNSMSAGTSASAATQADAGASAAAPKKVLRATAHYPKAEAKLNSEEALQTKQLNIQAGASASGSAQP